MSGNLGFSWGPSKKKKDEEAGVVVVVVATFIYLELSHDSR